MATEPLIGIEKYRALKTAAKVFNKKSGVTRDGICLFEGGDCIYTVGLYEHGLRECIFELFETKKGRKSDLTALMLGLKQKLTVNDLKENCSEIKLGNERFYVIGVERELGGDALYFEMPNYVPGIYIDEKRPFIAYFPATRKQVDGW